MTSDSDRAVALISRLEAVPTILKVITETTGLRLSLVARVTDDSWTACAVHDVLNFGLSVGDHLELATTLCREVRESLQAIVIDHASVDPTYHAHPTPKLYRFESYIAVPIFRRNGEYFGNVCALDSRPAKLSEAKTLEMMKLFADLIALQLEAEEQQEQTRVALLDEVLRVTNKGKPIAAELLPRLFHPFVRNVSDQSPKGLGLGLFIVEQIARSHGGGVQVRSTHEATTFVCTLPRR